MGCGISCRNLTELKISRNKLNLFQILFKIPDHQMIRLHTSETLTETDLVGVFLVQIKRKKKRNLV